MHSNRIVFGTLRDCYDEKSDPFPIMKNDLITIGRHALNTIVIDRAAISKIHCSIWSVQFDESSVPLVYIRDQSLNGTYINGKRLKPNDIWLLDDGDKIFIEEGAELQYFSELQSQGPFETSESTVFANSICKDFENWKLKDRLLGKGTFGYVFVAERKLDSKICAVKVIRSTPNYVPFEAKILMKLNHPNIIKVYETRSMGDLLYIFEDLICGGDLFSYLAKGDCLNSIPEFEALVITFQVLQALRYLHQNNICHRDLKLDNILLEAPQPFTKVVLADFGIAKSIRSPKKRMFTVVGTPEYCAPEVGFETSKSKNKNASGYNQLSTVGYNSKCDIWSLGVIVHIMLSGISPFYADGEETSIIKSAKTGLLNFNLKQWKQVTAPAKDFVQSLLNVDIEKRLGNEDCFHHIWIRNHGKELAKIYDKILKNSKV